MLRGRRELLEGISWACHSSSFNHFPSITAEGQAEKYMWRRHYSFPAIICFGVKEKWLFFFSFYPWILVEAWHLLIGSRILCGVQVKIGECEVSSNRLIQIFFFLIHRQDNKTFPSLALCVNCHNYIWEGKWLFKAWSWSLYQVPTSVLTWRTFPF